MTIDLQPDAASPELGADHERFAHDRYVLRRQFLSFPHTNIRVYDPDGELVLFTRMKGFKLKEDLRLYADESRSRELISITTQQVIDFSAGYQVYDHLLNEPIGSLKRRGFKSMLRDEWAITDAMDRPVGIIREDSTVKALVRRFIDAASLLMPQKYHAEVNDQTAVTFQQNFNPFLRNLNVEFFDTGGGLDRRLGLAAAVLLLAIEGRQG